MFKPLLFFLLIASLPFQLGFHFWPSWSYVAGFPIDYLSPTFYLFDFLLLLNLPFYLFKFKVSRKVILILFFLFLFNLFTSDFSPITLFSWLKILEVSLFFLILKETPNLASKIKLPFLTSLFIICLLSFLQVLRQESVQGIFYWLGEREFNLATPNITKIGNFIRPPSTFSHPNSLAGYLLLSFLILKIFKAKPIWNILVTTILLLAFSRTAILTFILIFILNLSFIKTFLLSLIFSFSPLLSLLPAMTSRLSLLIASLKLPLSSWVLGIGLNQFIPSISQIIPPSNLSPSTLQPLHNLFLLVTLELGLIPLTISFLFFKKKFIPKINNTSSTKLLSILLLTGSLDHYWWTLPQNRLILVLAVSLIIFKNDPTPTNHYPHRRRR